MGVFVFAVSSGRVSVFASGIHWFQYLRAMGLEAFCTVLISGSVAGGGAWELLGLVGRWSISSWKNGDIS